jgi:hypothetical protein
MLANKLSRTGTVRKSQYLTGMFIREEALLYILTEAMLELRWPPQHVLFVQFPCC